MKAKLKSELTTAMKSKNRVAMDTLRSILSAIQYEEMQKEIDNLSDEQHLAILKNEAKKRTEAIEFAEKAGRTDEIEKLKQEQAIIDSFLPAQLSEAELEKIISGMQTSSEDITMGVVMKQLKDQYPGQYDGRTASDIAKRILG